MRQLSFLRCSGRRVIGLLLALAPLQLPVVSASSSEQTEESRAASAADLADSARLTLLKALSTQVSPGARSGYSRLCDAAYAYADVHSNNEVDLTGSGRDDFMVEDRQNILNDFVNRLQALFDNRVAPATELEARAADVRLNAIWAGLTAHPETLRHAGTVRLSGIRETQRTWLKYRDAFVRFARLQAGVGPSTSILFQLTSDRSREIDSLIR